MLHNGRIYKGIGGFYYVKTASGVVECRARGRFRLNKTVPSVGDYVSVDVQSDNTAYLVDIMPRHSHFKRPPVSNIDLLAIVASQAPPMSEPFMVDRMTAVAVYKNIEPLILLNKSDLEPAEAFFETYRKAGFKTLMVSAETGEGCAELLDVFRDRTVAFSGISGVGKSSLLNRILPLADAEVGGLQSIGRGKHTTRHVELFDLPNGGVVADTPGFSSFDDEGEQRIPYQDLERCFPEFEPYLGSCRFTGCAHVKDSGCSVLCAVEDGAVSLSRHESYCKMYTAAKSYNPYK